VEEFAESAQERLKRLAIENAAIRVGDGSRGWAEHAPYDKILVAAGAKEVPAALVAQLKPGGRLVMPLGPAKDQRLSLIRKEADDSLEARAIMPVRFSELET
jgi:protein-L-isoaspartate(D-aspartate) O-methyltransferase